MKKTVAIWVFLLLLPPLRLWNPPLRAGGGPGLGSDGVHGGR